MNSGTPVPVITPHLIAFGLGIVSIVIPFWFLSAKLAAYDLQFAELRENQQELKAEIKELRLELAKRKP